MDTYVLNDGTSVEIRPIAADDGERLQVAHERLSPETQYRRYLGAKPTLTPDDARYLVEIDGADHVALIATAPVDGDEQAIIAVARFVRLSHDSTAAEFAIVIADAFQRQGLGGELMRHLVSAALDRGITHFRATTHTDNRGLFALLEAVAAPGGLSSVPRGSISDIEVRLQAPAVFGERRQLGSPQPEPGQPQPEPGQQAA